MESLQEWFERFKAEQAKKSPEQLAAEEAEFQAWFDSLPVAPEPGGTQVIFFKRKRKEEKEE